MNICLKVVTPISLKNWPNRLESTFHFDESIFCICWNCISRGILTETFGQQATLLSLQRFDTGTPRPSWKYASDRLDSLLCMVCLNLFLTVHSVVNNYRGELFEVECDHWMKQYEDHYPSCHQLRVDKFLPWLFYLYTNLYVAVSFNNFTFELYAGLLWF